MPTFAIVTLGCPKNTVDSEGMAQLLVQAGYECTPDTREADVVIVNTCGFIESAKRESVDALARLSTRKRRGQVVIAAGCLTERYGSELSAEMPEVDGVLGTLRWGDIREVVAEARAGKRPCWTGPAETEAAAARAATSTTAYVKIAEGCDATCAFCAIPSIKGPYRSKAMPAILEEARQLAAGGVKEIVLIAQDTSVYGRDLGLNDGLAHLLEALVEAVPTVPWLRVMYAYPSTITPRLIETIAAHPRIVKYLDLPLQHSHPDVLRRMRRPLNGRDVVEQLRAAMPDIALRTTLIVGFPGETDGEFAHLLSFVEEIGFDRLGAFPYSKEEGTLAAGMPRQVPKRVKVRRYRELMQLQQRISHKRNQALIGKELDVLVEPAATTRALPFGCVALGRSYRDAPEVDGLVYLDKPVPAGTMVRARIANAMAYDVVGEMVKH